METINQQMKIMRKYHEASKLEWHYSIDYTSPYSE